jgi:hypothetical protein
MSSLSSPDETALPPPASLAIHLDLVGGLAGDMFVAALVDALPALKAPVLAAIAAVQPAGEVAPGFREASSGGLRALRFGLGFESAQLPYRAAAPPEGRLCTNTQAPRTRCCAAGSRTPR